MGMLASLPFAVGFLSQVSSGWMLDKLTKQRAQPIILDAFMGLAFVLFFVGLVPKGMVPLLILVLLVQGYLVVLYDGPLYTYMQMRYPATVVGAATGLTQSIGQIGAFLAPTISCFLVVQHGTTSNYAGCIDIIRNFNCRCSFGLVLEGWSFNKNRHLRPELQDKLRTIRLKAHPSS
jgi:MFS family permease